MNLFVTSDTRFAIFETLLVFFDRQHRLKNTSEDHRPQRHCVKLLDGSPLAG